MRVATVMIVVVAVVALSFAGLAVAESWGGESYEGVIDPHTTDDDFTSESVDLDNMTVEGTGEGATVNAQPFQHSSYEDFEPSGGYATDGDAGIVFTPENPLSGVEIGQANDGDQLRLLNNETGQTIETYSAPGSTWEEDDTIEVLHDFEPGTEYRLQFENSDGSDIQIYTGPTETPVTTDDYVIHSGWVAGSPTNEIDGVQDLSAILGGDSATYIATLDGTSVEDGVIDVSGFSDADVSVTYQIPDNGDWQDVTTESITGEGEHYTDLDGVSADEWRVILEAENTGTDREDWTLEIGGNWLAGERYEPEVSDLSPGDGAVITDSSLELEADIHDGDFGEDHGDEVVVTFYDAEDDTKLGSETIQESQTVSIEHPDPEMGENSWYVVAEDEYGAEITTDTYTFETPNELHVYDETDPDELVENVDVTVTFFGEDEEVISETTSDGVVDLSGLPLDQELTVQVEADEYITRQTIIRSITEQQEVFILPDTADTVSSRFEIRDPTGQIQQENSRILIKKPISRDEGTVWHTVVADEMGAGGFSTVLEQDRRYKIEIEDLNTGEIREMGPYIATESETVILDVDELQYEFEDEGAGYRWNATWLDEDDPAIDFVFDADHGIVQLDLTIVERGGNETVVADETWTDVGSVQHKAVIPEEVSSINTSSYNVEWEATIVDSNGEEVTVSGSSVAGPRTSVSPDGVSDRVLSVVGVFLILMVAGLFSYANVGVGGVVTSLFAGLLWFVGILPGAVSGMAIGLALIVSILWMARLARGPY